MLLSQAKLKHAADEREMDRLANVIMHKGSAGNKDDQTIGML